MNIQIFILVELLIANIVSPLFLLFMISNKEEDRSAELFLMTVLIIFSVGTFDLIIYNKFLN